MLGRVRQDKSVFSRPAASNPPADNLAPLLLLAGGGFAIYLALRKKKADGATGSSGNGSGATSAHSSDDAKAAVAQYIEDILSRARAEGHPVPSDVYRYDVIGTAQYGSWDEVNCANYGPHGPIDAVIARDKIKFPVWKVSIRRSVGASIFDFDFYVDSNRAVFACSDEIEFRREVASPPPALPKWVGRPNQYAGVPIFGALYDEWMNAFGQHDGRWNTFVRHLHMIGYQLTPTSPPPPPGWPHG